MLSKTKQKSRWQLAAVLSTLLYSGIATCHQNHSHQVHSHPNSAVKQGAEFGQATYLGNEAVMIEHGDNKILFDPFFHNSYGTYQLVPEEMRQAMMLGQPPYDNIDAIFISHAHGDHFSAQDVLTYLTRHQNTWLVAPNQAIEQLYRFAEKEQQDMAAIKARLVAVPLNFGDQPWRNKVNGLVVEAVRIPHAGWPQRAEVENLVFRVALADEGTKQESNIVVMHMGDADPDDDHFRPFKAHWQRKVTDTAFPPYWFFYSMEGNDILTEHINAKQHIGVHVPVNVPKELKATGKQFFSKPGQQQTIGDDMTKQGADDHHHD